MGEPSSPLKRAPLREAANGGSECLSLLPPEEVEREHDEEDDW